MTRYINWPSINIHLCMFIALKCLIFYVFSCFIRLFFIYLNVLIFCFCPPVQYSFSSTSCFCPSVQPLFETGRLFKARLPMSPLYSDWLAAFLHTFTSSFGTLTMLCCAILLTAVFTWMHSTINICKTVVDVNAQ